MTNVVPKANAQVSAAELVTPDAGPPHAAREYDTHEPVRGFHRGPAREEILTPSLLFALVDDLVVRFDDVFLRLATLRTRAGVRRGTARLTTAGGSAGLALRVE